MRQVGKWMVDEQVADGGQTDEKIDQQRGKRIGMWVASGRIKRWMSEQTGGGGSWVSG